ncbi:hypothetical protein [Enterobacter cloacae]|uniref:SLATT domain-containing protein n=1 Tax=Enterobacter cloacae TaxID=550 RepID=A0A3R8ZAL3_ENTCL|nr:hypothetical protein [Enterobacter cloacae]RSB30802.1 hypothetical protein EGK68_11055 [Enterobacter cloacae]
MQKTLTYSNDELHTSQAFQHLDMLIQMAESSHGKINALNKAIRKLQKRNLTIILIAYAMLGIMLTYTKEKFILITINTPFSYMLITTVIVIAALLYILINYTMQKKEIKTDIEVERRILKDILELSFDIKKTLINTSLSNDEWMSLRIIEMRLRRLEFN